MTPNLAELLPAAHIRLGMEMQSKKRVFEAVGVLFEDAHGLSRDEVFRMLLERERLGSTCLGGEGAIPHGRMENLTRPLCALVRLKKPIPYDAEDGNMVRTMFFLLAPQDAKEEHLCLLAAFSRMLSDADFMAKLDQCAEPGDAHALVAEWSERHREAEARQSPDNGHSEAA